MVWCFERMYERGARNAEALRRMCSTHLSSDTVTCTENETPLRISHNLLLDIFHLSRL